MTHDPQPFDPAVERYQLNLESTMPAGHDHDDEINPERPGVWFVLSVCLIGVFIWILGVLL